MKQETKYLGRKEVVAQLEGLISATNYARDPKYDCINCLPYAGSSVGARCAFDEEYFGVVKALKKLRVTKEEVNQESQSKQEINIFSENDCFGECISPDSLCEIVASILDKKGMLK